MCNKVAKHATREALGETVCELIHEGYPAFAIDADLSSSTTLTKVRDSYPDRFLNVGIAEQCMMGVAAGLSLEGYTCFTGSFAVFATGRAYDQIRNTICDSDLNVKICPTHAGITVGKDGATHQALEDIGMMRALPNMRVLTPSDYTSARAAIRYAASVPGPFYVRLSRHPTSDIYSSDFQFDLPNAQVLRQGSDVSIFACGVEVSEALHAAEILESSSDISAEVIDVLSVKPLDKEVLLRSAEKTGLVVTCEEHSIETGLGAAVSLLLCECRSARMKAIGTRTFGTSGSGVELLSKFKLDAKSIAHEVESVFNMQAL